MVALRVLQSAVWRSSRVFNHLHPRSSALAAACAEITQAAPLARAVPRQQGFAALATRSVTRSATGDKGDPSHVAAVSDAALREKGLRLRLDVEASALIDAHREALRAVLAAIQHIPEASERDVRLVKTEIARLGDGFFMLVVAGEYNAGKSSLINALLGRDVLPEGPTPTTAKVTKLKYADQSSSPYMDEHGVLVRGEPVRVLASRLQIVDTPGTNAIDRSHEALTKEFLPLCDIVLFVTSADRPFSESERLFLESIRTWGKKVVLVLNKIDLLEGNQAKQEVVDFVSSSAKALLGNGSRLFALSAKHAKQAKEATSDEEDKRWGSSGLAQLEEYINEELDSIERLRLKLRASASVGKTVAGKYIAILSGNKTIIDADMDTVHRIETLLRRHEETLRKGYPGHFARVDNVLLEVLDKADLFFDTHVRVSNAWSLYNKSAMEQAFEEEVVSGMRKSVQRQVQSLGEWLADMSSQNLTETTAIFSRRIGERAREIAAMNKEKGIDAQDSSLQFSKYPSGRDIEGTRGQERLVTRLTEVSEDLSNEYISRREGKKIAERISKSIRLSAGLGLASFGSMSMFLMNSSSFAPAMLFGDPTIPVVASVLGVLGLATVPQQRMSLRSELRARVMSTRTRLRNELRGRLEEQMGAHVSGIRDALQPFTDFADSQNRGISTRMAVVQDSLSLVEGLDDKIARADMFKSSKSNER